MKKRYAVFAFGGFLVVAFALVQMGLTVVVNQTDNDISVSVVNESRKAELTSLFGTLFVGFPQLEGAYQITCLKSGAVEELGYTTKRGINRIAVQKDDIAC